jgi:hypothetical protein
MQNTILTANVAKAKLVYYKQKDTFKVVIAFNVHKVIDKTGEVKWKFPVQKQCNFVSGDISAELLDTDFERVLATAKQTLRTDLIDIVE